MKVWRVEFMKKKFGIGSLSLFLSLLAILWSVNFPFHYDTFCIGDYILTQIGLPAWSNGNIGTHYTVFWGLMLYLPAFILGWKYEHHLFARAGKWISGCISGYLIIMGCVFMIL